MAKSFKTLDLNGDGVISVDELQKGLARYLGVDESKALGVAKQIFKKVDLNNSGAIDFSCTFPFYRRIYHVCFKYRIDCNLGQS